MPNERTASQLAADIRAGSASALDAVEACLARIDEREDTVHAWAHLNPDLARAQARAIDAALAAGDDPGPLAGLTVGVKDICDTFDLPTESGSDIFKGRRPAQDATLVSLLRKAGAVILGKTVTTEFAMSGARATTNPHDATRTPGGSSSGSGAAVADRMVHLAIGSQTGGSVIRPASFCGTYGFKPTFGCISRAGVFLLSRRLDHIGVYGRALDDLALIGDALMVHDAADYDMRRHPGRELMAALAEPLDAAPRLGFVKGPPWDVAEDHMPAIFEGYVAGLGDVVTPVALEGIFDGILDCQSTIMNASVWSNCGPHIEAHASELLPETVRRISDGKGVLAADYIQALDLADSLGVALAGLFEHYDALITAGAPGEAPVGLDSTGNAAFQRMWTLTGLPTVTLPLLQGPNGLPIGVQVIGPKGKDDQVFKVAQWLDAKGASA